MKSQRLHTYIALVAVLVVSTSLAAFLPVSELVRGIAAAPGIAALLGILWQIVRDQAAFERAQHLQRQQHIFSLGTTSHMANVAFDKHVEFCEKYMQEVDKTVDTLFRDGPTEKASQHARQLFLLKREYAAWLPKDVSLALEPFEKAVGMIGGLKQTSELLPNNHQFRVGATGKMWDLLQNVLVQPKEHPTGGDSNVANEIVKEKIRSILGIEELTKIRTKLIQRALEALDESP